MRLVVALGCLTFTACGGANAFASSVFENDAEDWTISGNGSEDGASSPTLMKSQGNPGGNICGKDSLLGDQWYFVAPAKYLGNATTVLGKRLVFDLKQSTMFNQIKGRDVILNGGGKALVYNVRESPGTDWSPYSIHLDSTSGWELDDGTAKGVAATDDDFKTVLKNLTSLRIRGEFYDGPNDTACLDNVYFGYTE